MTTLRSPLPGGLLRVGCDIVDIDDIRASMERFGDRYTTHVFTDGELARAKVGTPRAPAALARVFAAKEAAIKALRPGRERPPWRAIEVTDAPNGARLQIHREAADLAEAAEMVEWWVTMGSNGKQATAVVVARKGHEEHKS